MLAQLTGQLDRAGTGTVVVLALADDKGAGNAITRVSDGLREPDRRLHMLSFVDLCIAALAEPDLAYWAHLFSARYLYA